jgi:ribonuclease PH
MREEVLTHNPVRDHVAAVSVGLVQGKPVLDLDYNEDSSCDADMNIVMTGSGQFVEVQGTAEGAVFERAALDGLLDMAAAGIVDLVKHQRQALDLATE